MYRESEKNLLNGNTSSTCPHNMANFGLLTAEICWRVWGTPANFNGVSRLRSVTARQSSSGRQYNFAALNRGLHLYPAGRLSRCALTHISSFLCFKSCRGCLRQLQNYSTGGSTNHSYWLFSLFCASGQGWQR